MAPISDPGTSAGVNKKLHELGGFKFEAGWKLKRKPTLLLTSAGISVCFVLFAGHGDSASIRFISTVSTLEDPLSMFAERSPGTRNGRGLRSTKPERTASNPHERVLSAVRARPPAAGTVPAAENSPAGVAPEDSPSNDNFFQESASPEGQSSTAPFDYFPSGFGVPEDQGPGLTPTEDSVGGASLSSPSPGDIFGDQGADTPSGSLGVPGGDLPPGQGIGTPPSEGAPGGSGTSSVSVPEPPTWWIMTFGLGLIAVVLHGRAWRAKQSSLLGLPL